MSGVEHFPVELSFSAVSDVYPHTYYTGITGLIYLGKKSVLYVVIKQFKGI